MNDLRRPGAPNLRGMIAVVAATTVVVAATTSGRLRAHDDDRQVQRVLLLSIDGMHAVDYSNCAAARTCPHLAELGESGVTYTRTSASKPSDSFPGLMALVTGGTPKTTGAYYDVAYDRVL